MVPSMNIVGCGRVASLLARLWHETGEFEIQQLCNRSLASGRKAAGFIGSGEAVSGIERFREADVWMIGTPDDAIWKTADRLAEVAGVVSGQLAFHLSGARTSVALTGLADAGLTTCSLHPLKSVPDALRAYRSFDGTWCALEGDEAACAWLEPHVQAIGGRPFALEADHKLAYHAANAVLSNYLVTLLDLGMQAYAEADIEERQARAMAGPLMLETLKNAIQLGPKAALTGPIARGDADIIRAHLGALPPSMRAAYREMGLRTLDLARRTGRLDDTLVEDVLRALEEEDE